MNSETQDFKLIAIRPLTNCDKKFLRILKTETLYSFYNNYDFEVEKNERKRVTKITCKSLRSNGLFHIRSNGRNLPVNLCAVVGKNGSGKSTLMELLFLMIYNLSIRIGILKDENGEPLAVEAGLAAELFYLLGQTIYCLKVTPGVGNTVQIELENYIGNGASDEFTLQGNIDYTNDSVLEFLFYTIAINYSLYGLNSKLLGSWINALFHKNDGYQTPVVINPMRTNGNIDINIENDLVKQRLLANILEPIENESTSNSLRMLAPKKIAKTLRLEINEEKILEYKSDNELRKVKNVNECLNLLYFTYTGGALYSSLPLDPELNYAKMYLENKLVRICSYYERYKAFLKNNEFTEIEKLVYAIIADRSHTMFKIKQTLNFMHRRHIPNVEPYKSFDVDISSLAKTIQEIKGEETGRGLRRSTVELIPPSIFKLQILFEDGSTLEDFSSGEKQKIHTLNSIVYHLINVNSVTNNGDEQMSTLKELFKYKYVNILFDEVELYFHPEFQRTFISDIREIFEKNNPQLLEHVKGINIWFSTHSPFILSDIPGTNILILGDDGRPRPTDEIKTFGANIHDLLKDGFFLKAAIGEFAKRTINETIDYLNFRRLEKELMDVKSDNDGVSTDLDDIKFKQERVSELKNKISEFNPDRHLDLIYLVDEPIVKRKLLQMFDDITQENEKLRMIQKKIHELQKLERKLNPNNDASPT